MPLQLMQHLQAEHRQFLHREQELMPIQLQEIRFRQGGGGAEPAVIWIQQGTDPEAAPETVRSLTSLPQESSMVPLTTPSSTSPRSLG
jgi:hypothetical protein